jgi:RHS repeat-associated protein
VSGKHWQTKITSPPDPLNQGSVGDDTVIDFQQDSSTAQYGNTHNFFETQRQVFQGSQSSGTILSQTITCYNTAGPTPANCPTASVSTLISRVTTFSYLPNTSGRVSETDTQYEQYSDPAFPSEIDSYDYGTTAGSVGALIRKVSNGWAMFGSTTNPTIVLVGTIVEDGSNNVKSSVSFGYNQFVTATSGTPQHQIPMGTANANVTSITEQVTGGSSPTYLYHVFTYYDTGMLNTATDWGTTSSGGPNVTTYNYSTASFSQETTTQSCGNSFVTSISEPLSLTRSFTWDCFGGVQTSTTDENGQTSTVYYNQTSGYGSPDPDYWRPYATTDPLNYATTLSHPNNTVGESALLFNNSNSVVDQRIKVDGFGRVILNQMKEGPSSTNYDSTETAYDVFGRISENYLPFTNTADSPCSGTCPGVTTTYDALNRPFTVTDGGGGTITYTYTNNDVYQAVGPAPSGQNTKRKQLQYDGLGRLSSVCEVTSATGSGSCAQTNAQTGFWTKYTYDVLGDTTGVTQNAQASSGSQQTRTYTFDMLGRLLTEQNPETGSITYAYDSWNSACGSYTSAGDLVEKTDAIGNVTCMKYDALHRVIQTTYPSGTYASVTPTKCYVYDSATVNGQSMLMAKTRLAEAYTTSAASCPGTVTVDEGFSYSARGEMQDVWEKTPDSGGYYHVDATYWANGRLNVLNGGTSPLPGLPAITYGASDGSGMDGKGRITKVAAASGQNPVNSISWNAGNRVTGVTFGSLDNDAYQYDPNTGRMKQYQFNMGTGPQSQTGVLGWSANSTLQQMQITDQINTANSQTCTYSYDDLTRITSANCGSVWAQTFSLDPFGNLSKSGSATFQPTYTGTSGTGTTPSNQYYQIPGGATGTSNYYDTNGNLKNDITNSYTWDADGNMLSVGGSTAVTMIYDALDRMAEQTRSSGHTEIVYGPYGLKLALMNGQTLVNAFVKLPGGSRAVYNGSGLAYYRHSDHLGSSRLATTPTRTNYYDVAYAPYGEDYNGSGTTPDLAFTDQNQDTAGGGWSTNLYDFMLREYRTAHGRWTSPDPAGLGVVDPTNPQTWNRYAYVLNNPTAMVDPLGLDDDDCYDEEGDPCGEGGDWGGDGGYIAGPPNGPGGQPMNCYPNGVCIVGTPLPPASGPQLQIVWTPGANCTAWIVYPGNSETPGSASCILQGNGNGSTGSTCPPGQNCSGQGGANDANNGQPQQQPKPDPSLQDKLNKLSCAFMASGVQFGKNGVKAGGQAAAAGGGMVGGSPLTGPFAPAVATAGGLVASGGATYIALSGVYEAFWQGMGYLGGCNAYGYSF